MISLPGSPASVGARGSADTGVANQQVRMEYEIEAGESFYRVELTVLRTRSLDLPLNSAVVFAVEGKHMYLRVRGQEYKAKILHSVAKPPKEAAPARGPNPGPHPESSAYATSD